VRRTTRASASEPTTNPGSRNVQGGQIVTTRTAKGGIFTRRVGIVAAAMGFVSFALGYLIHPM